MLPELRWREPEDAEAAVAETARVVQIARDVNIAMGDAGPIVGRDQIVARAEQIAPMEDQIRRPHETHE